MKINLKKKLMPRVIIILVMAASLQSPLKTIGQFILGNPSNPEQPLAISSSIQNTGCDIQQFGVAQLPMGVAVCDGSNPSFAWEFNNTTPTGNALIAGTGSGTITDPDIVLTHDGANAIIIYIQNGHCYFESWVWNGGTQTYQLNQPATMLSTLLATAYNPNIDIGYSINGATNYVAATWDERSPIGGYYVVRGRAGYFNGTNFIWGPNVAITPTQYNYSYQPDVCINTDFTGSTPPASNYVTFTYIQGNLSGTHSLYYVGETWQSLWNGITPPSPTLLQTATYPNTLSRPRIAATRLCTANPYQTDFEIVVESINTTVPFYKILGFNQYGGVLNPIPVCINCTPDISNRSYNGTPVVTYVGDRIIVSWSFSGVSNSWPNDILAKQLDVTGNVINPTFYSVVNNNLVSNQDIPSIAGKNSPSPNGNYKTLYVWHDANTPSTLQYKTSLYTNTSLRLANVNDVENTEISFYPNPASTNLTLDFGQDNTWIGSEVEIMNIEGQLVNKFTIDNLSTSVDISDLKEGLYFVKATNNDQLLTKKIMITH